MRIDSGERDEHDVGGQSRDPARRRALHRSFKTPPAITLVPLGSSGFCVWPVCTLHTTGGVSVSISISRKPGRGRAVALEIQEQGDKDKGL